MVCVRTNQHGAAQRLAFMADGVALGLALIGLRLEQEVHFEHAHAHVSVDSALTGLSAPWTVRSFDVCFVNVACCRSS